MGALFPSLTVQALQWCRCRRNCSTNTKHMFLQPVLTSNASNTAAWSVALCFLTLWLPMYCHLLPPWCSRIESPLVGQVIHHGLCAICELASTVISLNHAELDLLLLKLRTISWLAKYLLLLHLLDVWPCQQICHVNSFWSYVSHFRKRMNW